MAEAIKPPIGLSLPGLENIKAKFKTASTSFQGGEKQDNEALRRELVKVNTQFRQTQQIIQGDRAALMELAKSDERVAKLLALADDSKSQIISNKILDRAVVSQQEAALLIGTLKDATGTLTELDRTFSVSVGDVVRNFNNLVKDSRIDTESRRKMTQDIVDFTEQSLAMEQERLEKEDKIPQAQLEALEAQQVALGDLKTVLADSPSSADFEKNSDMLSRMVSQLGDKTTEIKTLTTLNNLNNTMDSSVLTQEELTETLDKQVSPGKSFEDFFKENPNAFSQGGIGGGIVSQALGSLGLGGLEDLIAPRAGGLLNRGLGSVGRLGARGVGGFGRGIGGMARGALGLARGGVGGIARAGLGAVGGVARGAGALGVGGLALGGKAAGGALGGAGKLLGGLGGLAGKAAGFAKFLGPLGLAISVGKGVFDAVDGFNRAAEIAGLGEGEVATFSQKIQAGASSALSGLSFGLLDEKEIFQGIEKVKGGITDGVAALGDFAMKAWEDPVGTMTGALKSTTDFVTSGGFVTRGIDALFGTDATGWFREKMGPVTEGVNSGLDSVGTAVQGAWDSSTKFLTESMADVAKFFDPEAIFDSVTEWGTGLASSIKDKIGGLLSFLPGFEEPSAEGRKAALAQVSGLDDMGGAPTPATLTTTPAQVTKLFPDVMPEAPAGALGSAGAMADIKALLEKAFGQRAPVEVKIDQVAAKPQLDRRTDIGDGFLGMLSTILDG